MFTSTEDKRILKLIKLYDHPEKEHYQIYGYSIPKASTRTKSVWVDGGSDFIGLFDAEITDREWAENYKNNLHPNDEWTNVDIDTYAKWINVFNNTEGIKIVDDALKAGVVGYLD